MYEGHELAESRGPHPRHRLPSAAVPAKIGRDRKLENTRIFHIFHHYAAPGAPPRMYVHTCTAVGGWFQLKICCPWIVFFDRYMPLASKEDLLDRLEDAASENDDANALSRFA